MGSISAYVELLFSKMGLGIGPAVVTDPSTVIVIGFSCDVIIHVLGSPGSLGELNENHGSAKAFLALGTMSVPCEGEASHKYDGYKLQWV